MTDTCPTWRTLLAWVENDLPEEESQHRWPRRGALGGIAPAVQERSYKRLIYFDAKAVAVGTE